MPIEIKELIIKATISPERQDSFANDKLSSMDVEKLKLEIKKECLEELKQFINDQKER